MARAAIAWLIVVGLMLALSASALGPTASAAIPATASITTNLAGTNPGTVSGTPPLQNLTISNVQLSGTTGGDIVGTMTLTMTIVAQAPTYTTSTFTGTWSITSGSDALNGTMSGSVTTSLNSTP